MNDKLNSPLAPDTFLGLLARSGLSKRKLAKILGVDPSTVTNWKDDAPQYTIAYLKLYVAVKELYLL